MRLKIFISIIVMFGLVLGSTNSYAEYTHIDGPAVSITSRGDIPLVPGPLLDDFSRAAGVNIWNDITGTFSKFYPMPVDAQCSMSFTDNPGIVFGGAGYSLKLDYNVTRAASYAGYFTKLGGENLSSYKYLSFWVKGAASGGYFKIELKNNSTTRTWDGVENTHYYRNKAAVYVTDYLDGGVTTSWKKVVIPLDAFANLDGLASMKELVFVFENSQCIDNGSPTSGTVYVDNVSFGNVFLGYVRLDHYGDKIGTCALGGNMGDMPNQPPTIPFSEHSFLSTQYHNFQNGLFSRYNVTADPWWSGIFIVLGGGNDDDDLTPVERPLRMGWIKIGQDFRAYERLSFWAKAQGSDRNPKAIVVEILDTDIVWPVNRDSMPWVGDFSHTTWKNYVLDIEEDLEGNPINRTDIKQVSIVYAKQKWIWCRDSQTGEWGWYDAGIEIYGGNLIGGLYIDEFEFRDISYTGPDTTLPSAPTGVNITGSGNERTVQATASAYVNHIYNNIECVRFDYYDGSWKTIDSDYDTTNTSYSVDWNVSSLSPGSYQVRAVAMDPAGNIATSSSVIFVRP